MRVVFHIISLGTGSGTSRVTRYISERDRDPTREGDGSRPLFTEDLDNLTYRKADRLLDPLSGEPSKDDLLHLSVSFTNEDFEKLGENEKERQQRLQEVIREGMRGLADELKVDALTWVAGIHRNSDHPHGHVVIKKDVIDRDTGKRKRLTRIPKKLLPHREIQGGRDVMVYGAIGQRFRGALEDQQQLYEQSKHPQLSRAEKWELLARKHTQAREDLAQRTWNDNVISLEQRRISASWNASHKPQADRSVDFRMALGKRFELEMRLAFAEVWLDRAVNHGDTFRFQVVDQSTGDERKLSELDVRRRAAARASRIHSFDQNTRNNAIDKDLALHSKTLKQLSTARAAKIEALGKDVSSLQGKLTTVERRLRFSPAMSADRLAVPLMTRETLSELQEQAVKLNLPDRVSELENLRLNLAREYIAPSRTDLEVAILAGQLNVACADFRAREARLDNFDASAHLTSYEVPSDPARTTLSRPKANLERWSLASIDKQIARRQEDAKLIPRYAQRLDLRALARINYFPAKREEAASHVDHLQEVRAEIVRRIEERRAGLLADRKLSREMLEVLQNAYSIEQRTRAGDGRTTPGPMYERYQINGLEASAETLRDSNLLREVQEWEKSVSKAEAQTNWEGRAVAREITSAIALEEAKERLHHFVENKKVASLHLLQHQTGTLREVQSRSITEYIARSIVESTEHRDHRRAVKSASRDHQGRLVKDLEKASQYHAAARELASEAAGAEPQFTDKEKINLEIYAERQNDPRTREQYLQLSRSDEREHSRENSMSQAR